MWTPKTRFFDENSIFDRIKLSNIQKNRAFMRLFCIITRFWCGRKERKRRNSELVERPGIEDVRRYKKALIFKAFLRWTPNFFWKELWDCLLIYTKIKVSFKCKNKPNMDGFLFPWHFLSRSYCAKKRGISIPCTSWNSITSYLVHKIFRFGKIDGTLT